jgi:prepilin-type N-terminal cleavage/methylation domain-containing protein
MKKQAGFTLVEIAIVMVIIGLLLGGVLKGQEIITNAKARNIENEFNGVTAAIYSYQDRYRAYPGDDRKANRWTDVSDTQKGDGDGRIEGDFKEPTSTTAESRLLWQHLRNARLIAGATNDVTQPNNTFGGITGVSMAINPTTENPGAGVTIPWLYIGFTNIPQNIALIIEARLDDGVPKDGTVQAQLLTGETASDAGTAYAEDQMYILFFAL